MANPVGLSPSGGQSIFTFYENKENLSSTIARKALEVAHRVPESDLQAYIFQCSQTKTNPEMSGLEGSMTRPISLPIQNEKKCLPAPLTDKYQAKTDLYSKEFGDYLLQSAGYEPTSLLEKSGKFLSKNECALFLNIETASLSDPKISVLIAKDDTDYGVAYFRDFRICKTYCIAKGLRSGQVRQAMHALSLSLFGIKKTETLETIQKPLVLSFQNPDCTSTCFLTFSGGQDITEEYILDEKSLSSKIESLTMSSGTYLHFTHDDLETICPRKEIAGLEWSLCGTSLGMKEVEHLL